MRLQIPECYDSRWILEFLGRRAIPGLESVSDRAYERHVGSGTVRVELDAEGVAVTLPRPDAGGDVEQRVRGLLDLDADSARIDAHLARDPAMAGRIAVRPGLRVPGAWDLYELCVRAILGQQVSVDRATGLAQRLVARYGEPSGLAGNLGFPSPHRLARENPAELGLPGRRGQAIRNIARAFAEERIERQGADPEVVRSVLLGIDGIGPWTAEYVAMRGSRDADAFPSTDWVVLKELATTAAAARRLAERWRPYRAYGVMYLWAAAARRKGIW